MTDDTFADRLRELVERMRSARCRFEVGGRPAVYAHTVDTWAAELELLLPPARATPRRLEAAEGEGEPQGRRSLIRNPFQW